MDQINKTAILRTVFGIGIFLLCLIVVGWVDYETKGSINQQFVNAMNYLQKVTLHSLNHPGLITVSILIPLLALFSYVLVLRFRR